MGYRRSLGALYLFDAALSGQNMEGTNLKKKEIEILDFCTKHALNEKLRSKPQGVEYIYDGDIPSDRTNIFRPILFQLFPNLVEIEMDNYSHALNLLSLLSVLEESAIPQSFKVLKVKDEHMIWLKRAVEAVPDIEKQFKAKGWKLEFKSMENGHWIFVSRA